MEVYLIFVGNNRVFFILFLRDRKMENRKLAGLFLDIGEIIISGWKFISIFVLCSFQTLMGMNFTETSDVPDEHEKLFKWKNNVRLCNHFS